MKSCICGSEQYGRTTLHPSQWGPVRIVHCSDCGQARDISEYSYESFYTDEAGIYKPPTEEEFELHVQEMIPYLEFIEQNVSKRGCALEIGCNAGYLLTALQDLGWTVYGLDTNRGVAAFAAERGIKVANQTLREADFKGQSFDLIIMSHVLEHIPDARSALEKAFKLLKPGGFVFVAVPNYGSRLMRAIHGKRWYGFIPGQHIWYFTKNSLNRTLEAQGFELVKSHKVARLGRESRYPFGKLAKTILLSGMRATRQGDELYGLFRKPNGLGYREIHRSNRSLVAKISK
jgi:2-polyprenyl-3-methyl-5-hydroxy-6-metoxy-1,4-benzoquinol methylase